MTIDPTHAPDAPTFQLRFWHLMMLVLFVATAIKNIQDQRREEPALIALAVSGFVVYGVIAWLAWPVAKRLDKRIRPLPLLILYLTAMAGLFLASTVIYLVIEHVYLVGRH